MNRDRCLSKGVRIEVVNAAKRGEKFTMTISTDDYIRIGAELRRCGLFGCMRSTTKATGVANQKTVTFNESK